MLPLLLKPNNTEEPYHLPFDRVGQIKFRKNEVVKFACPKGKVLLNTVSAKTDEVLGTCVSGHKFIVNDQEVNFPKIICSKFPFHEARDTKQKCLGKYREIEIGFPVKNNFIRHILLCFDDVKKTTLYSVATISKAIGGRQIKIPRPDFIAGNFFKSLNMSINTMYKRGKQQQQLNSLVGLASTSEKYIQKDGNYFMSRGHLTAKGDFIYGSVQRSTFYFVNAVPQWHTLNSKNWNKLEQNIQDFADKDKIDLQVFSGTEGVMTLPHEKTGESVEIHLFTKNKVKAVPVPLFIWKIVYRPYSKLAVAFVGVNNPFKYIQPPCKSICEDISWTAIKGGDHDHGYVYCCPVEEIRSKFTDIPEFEVKGLLH